MKRGGHKGRTPSTCRAPAPLPPRDRVFCLCRLGAAQVCKRWRSLVCSSRALWRQVELALPAAADHAAAVARLAGFAAWLYAARPPLECLRLSLGDCRGFSLTAGWLVVAGVLQAAAPSLRRLSLRLRSGHVELSAWLLPLSQLEFLEVGFTWSSGRVSVEPAVAQLPWLRCLHVRQASLSASPATFPSHLTELLLEEYMAGHAVPDAVAASGGACLLLLVRCQGLACCCCGGGCDHPGASLCPGVYGSATCVLSALPGLISQHLCCLPTLPTLPSGH